MEKEVRTWNLLKTAHNNYYFYDQNVKRLQLCHPLLFYILSLYREGTDPAAWLASIEGESCDIADLGRFSKREIEYYYRKFLFLEENGHFTDADQEERLSGEISAETVRRTMSNITQVTFEVTDRCNLDCRYCGYGDFYDDHDQRENKNLDPRLAKTLLDYLLECWNSSLNQSHNRNIFFSFYGGEPLLNMGFIREMVDYARKLRLRHNHFTFNMTTNGLLIREHMDFLSENRIGLLISLDGDEAGNAYRVLKNGKPSYRLIMENVEALRRKYPDYFQEQVKFNAVLHNKNSVAGIYHFFHSHFQTTPFIDSLNATGIKASRKKEFWETYVNLEQNLLKSDDYAFIERDMFLKLPNIKEMVAFLFERNHFCFEDYNDLIYQTRKQKRIPTGTCLPFSKKIFMTVNGKLLPCERIGHQFELGNVSPQGVELDFPRIADKYNRYFAKMRTLCHHCCRAEACKQCALNLDTIDDEIPQCPGFMVEKDYIKDIGAKISRFEAEPRLFSRILREVEFE
jgi:uncharacterized protein